jgi:cell division protein FtsL
MAKAKVKAVKQAQEPTKHSLLLLNGGLLVLVVWTAVAIVESSHRCRQLYAELQALQSEQWDSQEQWSRLLLEESTWATYHRIEQVAVERLGMQVPAMSDTRVVAQ